LPKQSARRVASSFAAWISVAVLDMRES
jgi:hypothetical protein